MLAPPPPLWSYRYNVQDADNAAAGLGVPHLFEAAAVFGPDSIAGGSPPSYYSYNAPIVPLVMDYWISFVKSLDPNPHRNAAAPRWEPWRSGPAGGAGAGGRRRLVFETGNLTMEDVPADEVDRCLFWLSLTNVTEQ